MKKQKICLIELGGSHFECMETQIHFLKDDFHLTLLTNSDKLDKASALVPLVDEVKAMPFSANESFTLANSLNITRLLKKSDYDFIVLNTAQGGIKWICLLSFFIGVKAKFLGILHNVHKLKKGFGQRIISQRVSHYFVFGDFLEKYAQTFSKKSISSFLPIFVRHENVVSVRKPADEFWICIPGNIEFKRRDYPKLLDAITTTNLSDKVRFVLLGATKSKDAEVLKEKINELKINDFFILFDEYIDTQIFNTYLSLSDCVLPLLTADSSETKLYQTCKVSGSWLNVLTFHKPLLCHNIFDHLDDLQKRSIFYSDLKELFQTYLQNPTHEMFSGLVTTDVKQDFEYQKQVFLKYFQS